MRTLKLALAFLTLLALLAGCTGTAPVEPEPLAATAETTQTPPAWRELDLEDGANAEIRQWLDEYLNPPGGYVEPPLAEYKLSDDRTLFERRENEFCRSIWLRDEATGKETSLLNHVRKGKTAYIQEVLSDRFFVFGIATPETDDVWNGKIYDVQRRMELPIAFPDGRFGTYRFAKDGVLYYGDSYWDDETTGQIHLFSLTLGSHWDTAETLVSSENLLEGILEADTGEEIHSLGDFSPDGRYVVMVVGDSGETTLRVFDLRARKFVVSVPDEPYWGVTFRDVRTLYSYDAAWDESGRCIPNRTVIEITLP